MHQRKHSLKCVTLHILSVKYLHHKISKYCLLLFEHRLSVRAVVKSACALNFYQIYQPTDKNGRKLFRYESDGGACARSKKIIRKRRLFKALRTRNSTPVSSYFILINYILLNSEISTNNSRKLKKRTNFEVNILFTVLGIDKWQSSA